MNQMDKPRSCPACQCVIGDDGYCGCENYRHRTAEELAREQAEGVKGVQAHRRAQQEQQGMSKMQLEADK